METAELLQDNFEESGYSLTATHLLEYLFCPRFTYFEYVLNIPQHEEKRFKVEVGRKIHERARKVNPDYLRKKVGVKDKQSDVYLSGRMGIRGIVDEILFLDDGTAVPLDYKYAEYKDRTFKNHRFQLVFYAQLIKDNFHVPVNRGFIVYTRSKNKLVEVPIQQKDFNELEKIVGDLLDIIQKCRYPKPTRYKRRCLDCCYRNICERTI
ncbi:MAG: CRISPR-associated protein Cas4 [Thermodesulfobacteriota bacterium]|nr:CRISPR-associated protein Cas4 [Thermodesulfobacteriota bacterium]